MTCSAHHVFYPGTFFQIGVFFRCRDWWIQALQCSCPPYKPRKNMQKVDCHHFEAPKRVMFSSWWFQPICCNWEASCLIMKQPPSRFIAANGMQCVKIILHLFHFAGVSFKLLWIFVNAAEIKVTQSLNKTNISYQLSLLSALLFPMTQVIAFAPRLIHHRTPATSPTGEGPRFFFAKTDCPIFLKRKEHIHSIHIFQDK